MDGKRRRGRQTREAAQPSASVHGDGSGREAQQEPHGDRYGQLADWIGVSAVGSGHADEVVGSIVGLRALHWWAWRLAQRVSHRRRQQ